MTDKQCAILLLITLAVGAARVIRKKKRGGKRVCVSAFRHDDSND